MESHKTVGGEEKEKKKQPPPDDVLLTADAPLSRVAQFARHDAAAE